MRILAGHFSKNLFFQSILMALFIALTCTTTAQAAKATSLPLQYWRVTPQETTATNLVDLLQDLNKKLGQQLTEGDFRLIESRQLATSTFLNYLQISNGTPIKGTSFRIWTGRSSQPKLIQAEAHIEANPSLSLLRNSASARMSQATPWQGLKLTRSVQKLVKAAIRNSREDSRVAGMSIEDQWVGARLHRIVKVQVKQGIHTVEIDLEKLSIVSASYRPHANADFVGLVYPIYEETRNASTPAGARQLLKRELRTIKNLKRQTLKADADPYSTLAGDHYVYSKFDAWLGSTAQGQAQGFWNFEFLFSKIDQVRDSLTSVANVLARGMVLDGRYATVSLHADVANKYTGIGFPLRYGAQPQLTWTDVEGEDNDWQIKVVSSFLGKPINYESEFLTRKADRDPNHDPVGYINSGFDEIQVYYAINELMEKLNEMGFTDPELSTKPFHAFLYDPDIRSRNNAYYTNDTINFSTYSPDAINFARDNTTIWHELGHGIMDRLMGPYLNLADTGGLSEGMADFIAALVLEAETHGRAFPGSNDMRIENSTGFFLTNEVHDDGEAYGGAMKDMLKLATIKFGTKGLAKMTDLTLETMRLTRNHPNLTAQDWFTHMLYADMIPSQLRKANEFGDIINSALEKRNFSFDPSHLAQFQFLADGEAIEGNKRGTRENPIPLNLAKDEVQDFDLQFSLKEPGEYKFKYPVVVEVSYSGGPLQGAIHWLNEDAGPLKLTLHSPSDLIGLKVAVTGTCDFANRENGDCVDFAYVRVFNFGETKPVAKKRFYLRVIHPDDQL